MNSTYSVGGWLLRSELQIAHLLKWIPGLPGIWLRSLVYSNLFKRMGDRIQIMTGGQFSGVRRIELGHFVKIDRNVKINAPTDTSMRLGDHVRLGEGTLLSGGEKSSSIVLGRSVEVEKGTEIKAKTGRIEVGQSTYIGAQCNITSAEGIKIGQNCHIGDCSILRANQLNLTELLPSAQVKQPVRCGIVIEDNCWIGGGVSVLNGVTIGQGSVISDNSVIVDNVPAFSIAMGAPARILKGVLKMQEGFHC
ncbi:MAG: acyltransferase [Oscillatoriophycideae cyanobacterium NC_groundwater_1537_Pr4_S-0.65um_50_18]|nr:acyltransferase [Oscillatoriophycideae cyanobacterium NC_groundwater_1537_Pr4_S-0.65um_50_18]